jgi:hypothetical protein
MGDFPSNMLIASRHFLMNINGLSPVHLNQKDRRDWGEIGYYVRNGCKSLLSDNDLPKKLAIWKEIWNANGLPKINIFEWQLAHSKLLTCENLLKRCFMGPFRCAQSNQDFENIEHIFLNCNLSKKVMHIVYSELTNQISWPTSYRSLIEKWRKSYKGSFKKNTTFHRTWNTSIKKNC